MNKLKTTLHGDIKQVGPKWIEVKVSDIIHVLFCSSDVL